MSDGLLKLRDGLNSHYRSGHHELAKDFFEPCLMEAVLYRRSVGYFSSSALTTWAAALPRFVKSGEIAINLVTSPKLFKKDISVLRRLSTEEERDQYRQQCADRVLAEILEFVQTPGDNQRRAKIFAWLVANSKLQLRFAFPRHATRVGVFHEKIGIFDFPDGTQVAFTGSANETFSGHTSNYESIDVYRSWIESDRRRVATKAEQFDETWKGKATGLEVMLPSKSVVERLIEYAPETFDPSIPKHSRMCTDVQNQKSRWRHQEEAVDAFLSRRCGILEMATGTGKTRTAIKILERLFDSGRIESSIVTTDGNDLLEQWSIELEAWNVARNQDIVVNRHFQKHKELGEFKHSPSRSILVIRRSSLNEVVSRMTFDQKKKTIVIHDEVHGAGMPTQIKKMKSKHRDIPWRLGLSATPEREYDEAGTEFVQNEIGPVIFKFPLEEAIKRQVLCRFAYLPLAYDLTDDDRYRIRQVYKKEAYLEEQGTPMTKEQVWIEVANVYKTAEQKPFIFAKLLKRQPHLLRDCIVFVENREYGDRILSTIHKYTDKYRTYYAGEDSEYLSAFGRREIDCLITCHRLSQGIDIKSLQNIVLFSSSKAKLETIQRIGRCLRADPLNPTKCPTVVDFVMSSMVGDEHSDSERASWLTELSKVN